MQEDFLLDHILESLEKMAPQLGHKNPNEAIVHYGSHMDDRQDPKMIHDALSHHASHYKAALKAGDTKLADKHMRKIFEMVHMSEKLTRDGLNDHSKGKLKVKSVDPKPWERSLLSNKHPTGKFVSDPRGWAQHRQNYDYLRDAPPQDLDKQYQQDIQLHGHKKAYPLEEMEVNGKPIDIDENVTSPGKFVPHSFDSHPVMDHYKTKPDEHTLARHAGYIAAHDAFHADKGQMDQWRESQKNKISSNKGLKSIPVHADVPARGSAVESVSSPEVTSTKSTAPNMEELKAKLAAIRGKR